MATVKISELESASSVTSSDVLPIVQNGETKKVEYSVIQDNIENSVIESGSNENGYYTKFSDGTLICRGAINVGTVPSNTSTTQGWVFPYQPLNTNYQVVTTMRVGGNYWSWLKERTIAQTVIGITLEVWNNSSGTAGASSWDVIMIGRWK